MELLPWPTAWRSVTVAAGAFPNFSSDAAAADSTGVVPRADWLLWQNLVGTRDIPRIPDFGDYTISSPELTLMDPRLMTVVPSVRYAAGADWVVIRGHRAKGAGKWGQMRDISRALVARPDYRGASFSAGDAFIDACATGTGKTGSAKEWRTVGTNHHIHTVVEQLST